MSHPSSNEAAHPRPRVAVSACLLGEQVRYDGAHKRDRYITDQLAQLIDFVPVCPEVEAGLGVPRPTIQLRKIENEIRVVRSDDAAVDVTEQIDAVAEKRAQQLTGEISGFILKKKSPSCGMERVPVAIAQGRPHDRSGIGRFAQTFHRLAPLIPLEEEGRLCDAALRENFLERVYALHRWQQLDLTQPSSLVEFHARHKFMLMARGGDWYVRLGRIVAGVTRENMHDRATAYIQHFMQVMARVVTRKRQINVLQHAMGYLKQDLAAADKQELLEVFQAYRHAYVPLAAPLTLLRHHLRKHPQEYLARQHYFEPYPDALALRAAI
ncbi:MAG: YbgA family protein [Gammaproteobacteria bacterium]